MSGRRLAILIASSRFPEDSALTDLRCTENDVDGLEAVLGSGDHGRYDDISSLKNVPSHEAIHNIHRVLKGTRKNDLVLIYYSGHGKLNEMGRLYLATPNTETEVLESTSISVDALKELMDASPSRKKVLMLDCCYSGAAGEAFTRKGDVDDQLRMAAGGQGTCILTASTGAQTAQEKEADAYGVFTKHLIEGIRSGAADMNDDGLITADELYDYVHDRVKDEGFQEPMKWGLNVKGQLVIAYSATKLWERRKRQIRKLILKLADQDILTDDIVFEAFEVISMSPENMKPIHRRREALLVQLLEKRLRVIEFGIEWKNPVIKKETKQIRIPVMPEEFLVDYGMGFIYIPPGEFMMGSPEGEPGGYDDEKQHKVIISKGFYLQETPVTQGQWSSIMGDNPSHFKNCGGDCPIESVSWEDVRVFLEKLNKKAGSHPYRLPTEAEWEYACRAGTTTALYSGPIEILGENNAPALDPIAWYGGNSGVDYEGGWDSSGWKEKQYPHKRAGTHPVKQKEPNAWGLYDMIGNVWEWCADWYGDYPDGPVTDPSGLSSGSSRVFRGGSWSFDARYCRSAYRGGYGPGPRGYPLGFRLARSYP